ncbi:hypothetical protein [uncultured Cyclobacterium sp.]|uniref:hypothetical protein n=1 Tax=uncultured Cyclobacterium sp. TaxID=453820 RepID=UPI0030EE7346|tara:strand:- start:32958 stop:33446 length:489 start_codon:yes stop_codon:yes gene_type:complete
MQIKYYGFFKDGNFISKMTLEEILIVPYIEHIIKSDNSPMSKGNLPQQVNTILNNKGEEKQLKFGCWELIDITFEYYSLNNQFYKFTFYDNKHEKTYKRTYFGGIENFFFNDVICFMKKLSDNGGWKIYEYEIEIEKLNKKLIELNREIDYLNNTIEELEKD